MKGMPYYYFSHDGWPRATEIKEIEYLLTGLGSGIPSLIWGCKVFCDHRMKSCYWLNPHSLTPIGSSVTILILKRLSCRHLSVSDQLFKSLQSHKVLLKYIFHL